MVLRVFPPTFTPVNNLICCQTGLMWVVKRETTAIQLVFQQCCRTSCTCFVARFFRFYLNITLKQPRRQGQRKLHLKSQFTLFQSSLMLSHFIQFVKCSGIFFRNFNSKGLFLISEKEKENCCLVFASYVKRETRRFLRSSRATTAKNCTKTWIILSVQKRVMHEQSYCFADLNIVFLPFSLVSPSLDYYILPPSSKFGERQLLMKN